MRARGLVLVAVLALGACGSRVEHQVTSESDARESAATGAGLGAAGEVPTGASTVPGAATGSGTVGGTGSPSIGSGGTGTGAGGGGAAPSAGGGEQGSDEALTASSPGVTADTIKIGLAYDTNAGVNNTAFGIGGIGQVDQKRGWEALVAHMNEQGGVAGRKVEIVWFAFDSTSNETPESVAQQMCQTWTKDDRVFAALVSWDDTLRTCMTEARVPQIANAEANALSDSEDLRKFPLLVNIDAAADRAMRFGVDRLASMGYYEAGRGGTSGYKLGIIRYDEAVYERVSSALKDQLAQHDLKASDEVAVKLSQTETDLQDEFAQIRAAALRFKQENVTHVQFIGTSSARLPLLFMQSAEKQLYRPRYGLVSTDGGNALATLMGGDAQAQLGESMLVSWNPIFDAPAAEYSREDGPEPFVRCIQIFEDAGQSFGDGDPTRNKDAIAAGMCDNLNYFKASVEAGGTFVTPDTWLQGVSRVNNLPAAATFIMTTTAQRHDGVGGVRDSRWHDDCSCFRYTSEIVPV
jgi:hypothetical protein